MLGPLAGALVQVSRTSGRAGRSRSAPTWDGEGTNFSLFSENAERVELCLFDDDGQRGRAIEVTERTAFNWHCYLPGVGPGPALRLPRRTARTTPSRPPLQPRQAADRPVREVDRGRGRAGTTATCSPTCPNGGDDADLEPDDEDDAAAIPKSVVIDPRFDWEGDRPPRTPWTETVIYETHVKGFTMRHPDVREELRGTYAGLASRARSSTSRRSASPRSSCCRSTTSPTSRSCSSAG